MAQPIPRLPPLSSTQKPRIQQTLSLSYPNAEPERFHKLSENLPLLWIRDARLITPAITAQLEASWRRYQTLGIIGKGDGGSWKCMCKGHRAKIEKEYRGLDREDRKAKEVALARYKWFVIRATDGTLDYGTDKKPKKDRPKRDKGKGKNNV
jgi:hypothetical protein